MGPDAVDELRHLVVDDPALRRRLLAAGDEGPFIEAVVAIGEEHGMAVSADAVRAALDESARSLQDQWV